MSFKYDREEFDKRLEKLLEDKLEEMCQFLNQYMSPEERTRIGEDIGRIVPNKADISTIKLNMLIEDTEKVLKHEDLEKIYIENGFDKNFYFIGIDNKKYEFLVDNFNEVTREENSFLFRNSYGELGDLIDNGFCVEVD